MIFLKIQFKILLKINIVDKIIFFNTQLICALNIFARNQLFIELEFLHSLYLKVKILILAEMIKLNFKKQVAEISDYILSTYKFHKFPLY